MAGQNESYGDILKASTSTGGASKVRVLQDMHKLRPNTVIGSSR